MQKSRSALIVLFALILVLSSAQSSVASSTVPAAAQASVARRAGVSVSLSAAAHTVSWDGRLPNAQPFELPLLYLRHGRAPALATDRTLVLDLSGLSKGDAVQLELVSLHEDVRTGESHRQSQPFVASRACTDKDPCSLAWTLDAANGMGSDFYTLQVTDLRSGEVLRGYAGQPDLVALDTWDVAVGAYAVRITYATLFPFYHGPEGFARRRSPDEVDALIAGTFVPMVRETWQTQFHAWGYGPIRPQWDADRMVEVYITCPPYALFGGTGLYTISRKDDGSPYPERRLWWLSSSPAYDGYDTLENGYRALYAHEFHHMVQWNVALSTRCPTERWANVFVEAQAKVAPTVQYPALELTGKHAAKVSTPYHSAARHYLAGRMNASYREMERDRVHRYDAALYWRFLYEQYGEMRIMRAALEEMACRYDPDIEAALSAVMGAAMARFDGPFQTFEESLIAFAEANYALRLENGRCETETLAECEKKYYDPNHTYKAPPLAGELHYSGSPLVYDGAIPASFGMDFVEVRLDRDLQDQPLRITFQGKGRFSVQIWKLGGGANTDALTLVSGASNGGGQPRALTPHPKAMGKDDDSLYVEWIPHLDTMRYDRLALIVTRLDPGERADFTGGYAITLDSIPDTGDSGGRSSPVSLSGHASPVRVL